MSRVGRVLPVSIWLMYSFETRAAASSVWVSPRSLRSRRTRPPSPPLGVASGDAGGGGGVRVRRSIEVHTQRGSAAEGRHPAIGARAAPRPGYEDLPRLRQRAASQSLVSTGRFRRTC